MEKTPPHPHPASWTDSILCNVFSALCSELGKQGGFLPYTEYTAVSDRNLTKAFLLSGMSEKACLWDLWKSPGEPPPPRIYSHLKSKCREEKLCEHAVTCDSHPSVCLSAFCGRVCFAGSAGAATFLQQVHRAQQEAQIWRELGREKPGSIRS